jgi:hypothetical protein
MRTRKMLVFWLILLLIFLMSNCVTTQQAVIPTCPPEGYVLINKDVLIDLMESCARTKSELNECLEREKVK